MAKTHSEIAAAARATSDVLAHLGLPAPLSPAIDVTLVGPLLGISQGAELIPRLGKDPAFRGGISGAAGKIAPAGQNLARGLRAEGPPHLGLEIKIIQPL